jgi:predicted nucleotidyltransferase component of viral defense system
MVVAEGRWLLKGAVALDFRLGKRTRTTKDLDLARQDDEAAATDDFLSAQAVDLRDHFVFDVRRTDRLDELREGVAVRYHVACELAGRRFDDITVDVAFVDRPIGEPDLISGPRLLDFADIEPTTVPAIPVAQHLAEKIHALTRAYGNRGMPSTRVKDLVDLVLIATGVTVDAAELRRALEHTFETRGRQPLPAQLSLPPAEWRAPYRRMAGEVGVADDIATAHAIIGAFVDPILARQVTDASWDPERRVWHTSAN